VLARIGVAKSFLVAASGTRRGNRPAEPAQDLRLLLGFALESRSQPVGLAPRTQKSRMSGPVLHAGRGRAGGSPDAANPGTSTYRGGVEVGEKEGGGVLPRWARSSDGEVSAPRAGTLAKEASTPAAGVTGGEVSLVGAGARNTELPVGRMCARPHCALVRIFLSLVCRRWSVMPATAMSAPNSNNPSASTTTPTCFAFSLPVPTLIGTRTFT